MLISDLGSNRHKNNSGAVEKVEGKKWQQTFPRNRGQDFAPFCQVGSGESRYFSVSSERLGGRDGTQNLLRWENVSHPGGPNESSSGLTHCFQRALAETVHLSGTADPRGPWQFWSRFHLIYREHSVDVSAGNGYFPGEAASGDDRTQAAKNTSICVCQRGDYRCNVTAERL